MPWIEILGWVGSAVLVVSLLQTRILRLRWINLAGCLILIGYNAVVGVWPMVGLNVVLAIINIVFLWRMLRTRHDAGAYAVVEVQPDDRYLAHVLDVHRADIAAHNPQLDLAAATAPGAPGTAYLVLRGDETVGAVLVRDAGAGNAAVVLDWVTPANRDFSPGEFVYRDSGLFADRGFERVLSPAGMRDPYYERVGFRPEGDRFVLDVARG